jgi:hypothetical protein
MGNSGVAEQLVASQKGLSSMQFVSSIKCKFQSIHFMDCITSKPKYVLGAALTCETKCLE